MVINNEKTGVGDYSSLLNRREDLEKEMAHLGRMRDLKVNLINDKYQNKINKVIRKLDYLDGAISTAKKYVTKN